MITYNHEKYVKHAIESILMQERDFDIEIIIGDDKSSDDTINIIKNYKNKFPDIIKPQFHNENIGMMANMIETLNRCNGKYIALLEGDDYWISKHKLKKQISFLEEHPEAGFCFHNATVVYDNSNKSSHSFSKIKEGFYNGEQVLNKWIVPTASVVFRNHKIEWPDFSCQFAHGDIFLFLLLLENGPAYYMEEEYSVYRKNDSSITNFNKTNPAYIIAVLKQLKIINKYFGGKYSNVLSDKLRYWELAHLNALKYNKKFFSYFYYLSRYVSSNTNFYINRFIDHFKS